LVSVSLSGTGFLMLMEGAFPARRGVCEGRGQTSRIGEVRLSNSRLNSSDGRNARRISPVSDARPGWKLFDRAIKKTCNSRDLCAYERRDGSTALPVTPPPPRGRRFSPKVVV
jgi:hypothetical protein